MPNTTLIDKDFKDHSKKGWLTVPQAARRWGINELTVRSMLKKGQLITVSDMMYRYYLIDPAQGKPGNSIK